MELSSFLSNQRNNSKGTEGPASSSRFGDIMTMPGLPEHPAAEAIDVDESGQITGLF